MVGALHGRNHLLGGPLNRRQDSALRTPRLPIAPGHCNPAACRLSGALLVITPSHALPLLPSVAMRCLSFHRQRGVEPRGQCRCQNRSAALGIAPGARYTPPRPRSTGNRCAVFGQRSKGSVLYPAQMGSRGHQRDIGTEGQILDRDAPHDPSGYDVHATTASLDRHRPTMADAPHVAVGPVD